MISLYQLTSKPSSCSYLPEQSASMHYMFVAEASAEDYQAHLLKGWRRFGRAFFRPVCKECQACQSIRVPAATFQPNRSQKRALKANKDVKLVVSAPSVTDEKLALHARFHEFQAEHVGWTLHEPKDSQEYAETFLDNPFPTEEWCYYVDGRLIGVGHVDVLPNGLSAIYFFYDPDERDRSLGTYNVMRVIRSAKKSRIPHVYLGYYVEGCRSLEYKSRFQPNEVLCEDGNWFPFREK